MCETSLKAAELLRARLKEMGWSQVDLANALGASTSQVSRWLSEERTPSLKMAFRIQDSPVGLPADIWISHGADESGEHAAIVSDTSSRTG